MTRKTLKVRSGNIKSYNFQDWTTEYADFHRNLCIVDVDRLNALGSDGWELVGTYSELETKFPNYGNDKYVTGIQSNVRTASIYLIFKRPLVIKEKKDSKGK